MSRELIAEVGIFAASLVLDQAEVDDTLDFEHSSDEDSEERLRQQAESVPLRPKDHVDRLDEVITRWLTFETEKSLQQPPTPAPPSQSTDSRNSPAPIAASDVPPPSVPQVVVDFLLDKITSDLPPSTSPAARAWNLLHSYMTDEKPPSGDEVKTSLDELQVGEEWHAMRIRIMQVEPDDAEAARMLLAQLEKMKPAEQVVAEQEVDPKVNTSLEPLLLDDEDDPTSEERDELEGLAALVAHAAMLEDCEVFYVRCQQGTESDIVQRIQRDSRNGKAPPGLRGAFPSMLPGGLYIRITSMLQMHTQASSYFRTIYGFKYPRKPIVLHPSDTIVLPPSKDVHLLMPIHRRVVDASQLIEQRRLRNIPQPRTWILAKKGRYRGDIGVVLDTEYTNGLDFDRNNQILVGFLPRLALIERPRKRPKVSHLQSEEGSSQHASTIVSALPVNGKRRAAQPRRAKVYQGSESILSFAVRNSIPCSKIQCYQCERPRTCNHLSKVYTMSGQTVTDSGIALVVLNHVDVQEATTILAKDLSQWLKCLPDLISSRWPLPSSWFFDHGERVQLALHYGPFTRDAEIDDEITSGSEGWIECVHSSGCDVAFINQANAPSLDDDLTVLGVRFIPFRFLIKVMQVGSRVEVRQDSGVAREGLVVAVGDVIAVKFDGSDDLTHPFHANSLKNLSLMPQIHLAHEPYHPRNELPTMGQPGTSNSLIDTSTGRIPWANTEIKVVGVENDNFAQMHKGSLGRVMDVVKNSSMKSGIGILVRFDAPSTSPNTLFDFDRIRRRDNDCFLAYSLDAASYFQFKPGYIPTHSPAEIRHVYGHPERIMQIQNERLSEARKKLEDEERAKDAARERLAIPSFGNRLENATFTQGGAPLTLRAGTPPPWTDWIDDPEITKVLPRGKVFVALRGQDDDVEVVISSQDGLNEAVYLVKPKGRAPIKTIITAQHLDPSKCSHTAANSYSSKLFLVCSGEHAGKLGRAVFWGAADDIVLKPVRHECQEKGKKIKTRRFQEIPVDGPLLRVSQLVCAHVPMMPDEDKAGKGAIAITQLQDILEKQLLGMQITDDERALLGE